MISTSIPGKGACSPERRWLSYTAPRRWCIPRSLCAVFCSSFFSLYPEGMRDQGVELTLVADEIGLVCGYDHQLAARAPLFLSDSRCKSHNNPRRIQVERLQTFSQAIESSVIRVLQEDALSA